MRVNLGFVFVVLYVVPYLLSGGIGLYSFVYTGPIFAFIAISSSFLYPGKSIWGFDLRGLYFFILPVISFLWLVYEMDGNAVYEWLHLCLGACTISLMVGLIRSDYNLGVTLLGVKIVVFILCVWAIIEWLIYPSELPTATYSNANRLSSFLGLIAPLLWVEGFLEAQRDSGGKWRARMLLVFIAIVLFVTGARLNQLAFLTQAVVVYWWRIHLNPSTLWTWVVRGCFILVVILSAEVAVRSIISSSQAGGIQEEVDNEYASAFIRLTMIYDGLRLIEESKGVGVGAGNITYAHSTQPHFGIENDPTDMYSLHNFPIQLIATYGFVGAILFLYTYISIWRGYVSSRKGGGVVVRSAPLLLLSFPFISLSPSYLFDYRPFYFVFGLVMASYNIHCRRGV